MLTAQLNPPGGTPSKELSSDHFVVLGGILIDAEGREIAELKRGVWHSPTGVYLFADIHDLVSVIAENEEYSVREDLGTFEDGVSIINGGIWSIERHPRLLAEFDYALNSWHVRLRPAPIMTKVTIEAAMRHAD